MTARCFDGFDAFRNQDWKMTLEQRADGDGTGMKLIWRNGDAGDDDPGDHTGKADPGPDWQENVSYHFKFDWDPGGFRIFINGELWFEDGFAEPYAPPNHRVSIGCYPRGETRRDAIYSNFVDHAAPVGPAAGLPKHKSARAESPGAFFCAPARSSSVPS